MNADDRELQRLAAKAAGIEWSAEDVRGYERDEGGQWWWNPLEDDGAALRLAVKLNLALLFPMRLDSDPHVGAGQVGSMTAAKHEPVGTDKCAATRRAIVRAAAEIGRKMP